ACGVWTAQSSERSSVASTRAERTRLTVSVIGRAQIAAPSAAAARTTAWMRCRVISGRTASCTTTISASSGAACSASHTESWRVRPPATTVRDASFTTGSRIRRARATQGSGAATTTTRTAGWRAKWRTVAARIGAGPSRRNCFGVRAPNRLPTPPAGMTATTLGIGALRRRHGRRRCLVARAREDHSARRRLPHARHDHVEPPAAVSPALLDDDPRHLDPEPGAPLEPAEHLERPAAATALEHVRRVGDPLELTQHKAGNDQGTIEEPRPADVGDPPVDDGRGIEDLVEPAAPAGGGEEPRRDRRQIAEPPEHDRGADVRAERERERDDRGLAPRDQRRCDETDDEPDPETGEPSRDAPREALDREPRRDDLEQ